MWLCKLRKMKPEHDLVVSYHGYKIRYLDNRRLWVTQVDHDTQISARDKEKLMAKLQEYYLKHGNIEQTFNRWNQRRLETGAIAASTHWRMEQDFKRFFKDDMGVRWQELDSEWFTNFIDDTISKQKLDSKRCVALRSIVKGLIQQAALDRVIKRNEWRIAEIFEYSIAKPTKKKVNREKECYSDEEVEKILSWISKDFSNVANLALLCIFSTGMRIGECVALKYGDIDIKNATIEISRREQQVENNFQDDSFVVVDGAKTENGNRFIPIAEDVLWIFEAITANKTNDDDFIFCRNGKRITAPVIRRRLKKICERVRVEHKPPHKIRKSVATAAFKAGMDEKSMVEIMGWKGIDVGKHHYDMRTEDLERNKSEVNRMKYFKMLNLVLSDKEE